MRLWVEIWIKQLSGSWQHCQPLREAVSWNNNIDAEWKLEQVSLFVRLWVEIYKKETKRTESGVSLFVRLWVEILRCAHCGHSFSVSLFVRLWVEMYFRNLCSSLKHSQPLREAVSWNTLSKAPSPQSMSSASSWGCELKYLYGDVNAMLPCQPLREAVSWNVACKFCSKTCW